MNHRKTDLGIPCRLLSRRICQSSANLGNQISNQQPARHNRGNCRRFHYAWIGHFHGRASCHGTEQCGNPAPSEFEL